MLKDIVIDYIEKNNCVVTSAPGNGTTSFILYLTNILAEQEENIIFYNPDRGIDRKFIKRFYPNVYNKVIFIESTIDVFIDYLDYTGFDQDRVVIDPGDVFASQFNLLRELINVAKMKKIKVLCTSQIRTNISNGGKTYSTLEKDSLFDYSIWIRNVSESNTLFTSKYIDVFSKKRSGNDYLSRYVAKFGKEGNVFNT